jgi:hypothetical protein
MILPSSDSLVDHLENLGRGQTSLLCWPQDTVKFLGVVVFRQENWVASFITQLETDKEGQA